jgi:CubicO group peptidase (beta-lactamase class C family)
MSTIPARSISLLALALAIAGGALIISRAEDPKPVTTLNGTLAPICERAHLPALAGAIVTSHGVIATGVVGVRKMGTDIAATIDDSWHLGSDTKAMTATLIGRLIDDGKLKFETTVAEVFPEIASDLPESFRHVTVAHLLAHRAGLPHDANWRELSRHGSLVEQRVAAVRAMRASDLVGTPGEKFTPTWASARSTRNTSRKLGSEQRGPATATRCAFLPV